MCCLECTFFVYLSRFWQSNLAVLRVYTWLCTQGSLLEGPGTIWDATDLIQVSFVQDLCLPHCTITSALNVYISGLLHSG